MRCPGTMHVPDGGGILLMCDTCGRRAFPAYAAVSGARCRLEAITPVHDGRIIMAKKPDRRTLPVLLTQARTWARNVRMPRLHWVNWLIAAVCVVAVWSAWVDLLAWLA